MNTVSRHRGRNGALLLAAILFIAAQASTGVAFSSPIWRSASQSPAGQPEHAQRSTSTPYRGDLSIFESEGRDQRLQIQRVMDLLGVEPGKSVADIGAGSGWFTVRAATRVGPDGAVYAEDINPDAIA